MAGKHVLIAYGSWAGSTREIAERVAEILEEKGAQVTVAACSQVVEVEPYDAVLVGTAVHASNIHPRVKKFFRLFHDDLTSKPLVGFVVCATMIKPTEENIKTSIGFMTNYTNDFPDLHFTEIKPFSGAFLYENARGLMHFVLRMMAIASGKEHRNWQKIESWASEVYEAL
ncbi:MAG: flavodoxin domain-containing protein [Anaerolineaceae bacterium]|nr:flavodoxin domain-containing protein [Anaerolineaceae bacterium]